MATIKTIGQGAPPDPLTFPPQFGAQEFSLENLGGHPAAPANGFKLYSFGNAAYVKDSTGLLWQISPNGSAGGNGEQIELTRPKAFVQTTDATVTTILTIPVPEDGGLLFRAFVECRIMVGTTVGHWGFFQILGGCRRITTGAVTLPAAAALSSFKDSSLAGGVTVTAASDGGSNLLIRVTGEASKTFRWGAISELMFLDANP